MVYKDYACPMIPLLPMDGKEFVAAIAIKEDGRLLENQFWIILKDTDYGVRYNTAPVNTTEELDAADRAGDFDEAKKTLIKSHKLAE